MYQIWCFPRYLECSYWHVQDISVAREREREIPIEVQIEVTVCTFVFIVGMWNLLHLNFCLGIMTNINRHILDGRLLQKEDGTGAINLTLGDLLVFVTGADHPPPLGFLLSPEVEFTVI